MHSSSPFLPSPELTMLRAISEHCLPKLVCELFTRETRKDFTEHERNLVSLIGYAQSPGFRKILFRSILDTTLSSRS